MNHTSPLYSLPIITSSDGMAFRTAFSSAPAASQSRTTSVAEGTCWKWLKRLRERLWQVDKRRPDREPYRGSLKKVDTKVEENNETARN
jgi:hypothetical protein